MIALLGPQKADSPIEHDDARNDAGPDPAPGEAGGGEMDARRALAELGIAGPVALITAGWQERESEDAQLVARLGVSAVNLRLHARSEEVFADDAELREAYKTRQTLLRHLQDFYRLRLDYADDAARAIAVRHVEEELLAEEWTVSVEELRQLDRDHEERCRAIHAAFEARWNPLGRPAIARHRRELAALLAGTEAVVIAGGHVASLLNRMRMFQVLGRDSGLAAGKHVIAWSAGAMLLGERVVLFHDFPPYGKDIAQVLETGFGLAPGLVVLPDPRRRIRTDDGPGIARYAQRMAPSDCVAMDRGAYVLLDGGAVTRAQVEHLSPLGVVNRSWPAGSEPEPRWPAGSPRE